MERDKVFEELREYKINDSLDKNRRRQLRANCHELRQLERQLQSAAIYKQLRDQQQNIARLKEEEFSKKREEDEKFAVECEEIRKSILQEEAQEKRKKMALREMLKSQICELQLKRRTDFEDIKKDREKMENLMKDIEARETAKRIEAQLLREKHREEMERSFRDIELRRQQEKKRDDDDTARNLVYQKQCDILKLQLISERKRIQKEKEALSERICQEMERQNQEKEKRDDLFLTLLVEEHKAKDDQYFRSSLVERINKREQFRIEIENYHQEAEIRRKQFMEEERKFSEDNLLYLEKRDKIDQLSNEKRRRKKMEHKKALREMIEMRRSQKANDLAARIVDFEKTINDNKKRDELIEEERFIMLNSVPKELLSYLPTGVLKSFEKKALSIPKK